MYLKIIWGLGMCERNHFFLNLMFIRKVFMKRFRSISDEKHATGMPASYSAVPK